MSIVTAVSAARPVQHVPEYVDPSVFAFARGDWGRSSYATLLESSARPSRLAASGMAATETPLTARDDGEAKRRLQVMEEVAARLAKLAESNRGDLAVRALAALRQKLSLSKTRALAAILRGDRRAALGMAEELEQIARAITAAEREYTTVVDGVDALGAAPILGPQTPKRKDEPPIAGEAALEVTMPIRSVTFEGDSAEAAAVSRAAAAVAGASDAADLRELTAALTRHSSPLLPLFDTSDGPGAVANEAAQLIRSLRRAASRPIKRRGEAAAVGAGMDASAIAASLGTAAPPTVQRSLA
ncbi:hypothetical protein KZ813_00425 [Sphingomonas sp. RHCKR7]|uniref:hypothetical protein n=1 Tax=Sphingomonas folli TaxID=2862497 RepID=UPI001CA477B9|nr:hypothetical protein [Sphingomonas folli]MBW6525298.1 hypothetical protein [Sphingomonas folli]